MPAASCDSLRSRKGTKPVFSPHRRCKNMSLFFLWQMSSKSLVFVLFCLLQHLVFLAFWIPLASVLKTLDFLFLFFFLLSFSSCELCYVVKITFIEIYPICRCFVPWCFLHGWPYWLKMAFLFFILLLWHIMFQYSYSNLHLNF